MAARERGPQTRRLELLIDIMQVRAGLKADQAAVSKSKMMGS